MRVSAMTERDYDAELDRQLKSVRKGESACIVCPWHSVVVDDDRPTCCPELEQARERLSHAALKNIDGQVKMIRVGLIKDTSIECPYCDGINRPENLESPAHWKREGVSPYCCDAFVLAVTALSEREAVQGRIDHMHRLQDEIAKAGVN